MSCPHCSPWSFLPLPSLWHKGRGWWSCSWAPLLLKHRSELQWSNYIVVKLFSSERKRAKFFCHYCTYICYLSFDMLNANTDTIYLWWVTIARYIFTQKSSVLNEVRGTKNSVQPTRGQKYQVFAHVQTVCTLHLLTNIINRLKCKFNN